MPLKRIICAMEKGVNGMLDTVNTNTQKDHKILVTVFKFMLFPMTSTNSKTCRNYNS